RSAFSLVADSSSRSVVSHCFDRQKLYEIHLAQTSHHLSVSWAAGGAHLLPGSGVSRKGRRPRELDQTGFPGTYLLDLPHFASHPGRLEFNCRLVISQVRSVAHSPWFNAAFPDPARRTLRRLRKNARAGHLESTANFDGESQTSNQCD